MLSFWDSKNCLTIINHLQIQFSVQPKPGERQLPPEKLLPQIASVKVTIKPPAYTNKSSRQQNRFNLDAEEGATVTWNITTNTAVAMYN